MRKSAGLLAAIILTVSVFTGCSSTSESAPSETSVDVGKIKQEIDAVLTEGPGLTAMSIDFNPANHGRIIPNITEYNEDAWEKEKDTEHLGARFMVTPWVVSCHVSVGSWQVAGGESEHHGPSL